MKSLSLKAKFGWIKAEGKKYQKDIIIGLSCHLGKYPSALRASAVLILTVVFPTPGSPVSSKTHFFNRFTPLIPEV